jgi:hypothetical protein
VPVTGAVPQTIVSGTAEGVGSGFVFATDDGTHDRQTFWYGVNSVCSDGPVVYTGRQFVPAEQHEAGVCNRNRLASFPGWLSILLDDHPTMACNRLQD